MEYLPIGLNLRDRSCVVVGGGAVGTRKIKTLLAAGADVTLIAPQATEEAVALAAQGRLRWERREYRDGDLDGALLAVVTTDNDALNARLVQAAAEQGVLACDASSAPRSQVIFGALHFGEGITLAVFTDGKDPALARRTRDRIVELAEEWEEK
jgi:uroporphyrin-III C-methyltransferase/precorrin-2 dehydrogenase/sirohydrochlorin ferrochelatase